MEDPASARRFDDLLFDDDAGVGPVYVVPLEAEQLATAHAGGQCQVVKVAVAMGAQAGQELGYLGLGPDVQLILVRAVGGCWFGEDDQAGGVAGEDAQADGVIEGAVEDGVGDLERAQGDAVGDQVGVFFLEKGWGEVE